MKKTFLLVILCCLLGWAYAGNVVSVQDAKTVSKNFIAANFPAEQISASDIVLQHTEYDENHEAVYYRFSVRGTGFIIVSATDAVAPVLAYSLTDAYDASISNYWSNFYKADIIASKDFTNEKAKKEWDFYLTYMPTRDTVFDYVAEDFTPLLSSTWNQTKWFNNYCPSSTDAYASQMLSSDCDNHVPAGCVATNMSVIMQYYRHPERGVGGIAYHPVHYEGEDTITYPWQVQSFNTVYDYDLMPNHIDFYTGAAAKLMWHAGMSVTMDYGPTGSGAQSADALDAMKNNWKYNRTAHLDNRIGNQALWTDSLKNEIRRFCPIYYSANDGEGGHAFMLDGYQVINKVTGTNVYTDIIDHLDTVATTYTYDIDTIVNADSTITYDTIATYPHYTIDTIYTIDHVNYDTVYSHTMMHVNWGWGGYNNGYYTIVGTGHLGGYTASEAAMFGLYPVDDPEKPTDGFKRVVASRGSISDGAGNKFYQPNTDRSWMIAAPNATRYRFTFDRLLTETGADEVIFYRNGDTNDVAARHSGYTCPSTFSIAADSVLVRFVTNDNDVVDRGFVFDFIATTPSQYCSGEVTLTGAGTITDKGNASVDENTPYRPDTYCTWKINSCAAAYFSYPKIELGAGDFIDIFDINNGKNHLIKRIDAYNWPTEDVFYTQAHKILIRFVSDNYEESNGFELTYEILTDLDENSDIDLSIYPNPASDNMYVDLTSENEGNYTFTITDLMGKVVSTETVENYGGQIHHNINLSNLSKGMYILTVAGKDSKTARKFIVE